MGMSQTILVVDDEKDIVDFLVYNLAKEGFRVLTANNGRKALEKLKEKPDLVILDIMMPEMNGLEVVREMKKDRFTASIPVLFLTAKNSEIDEIVGLEVGADDYITKPVRVGLIIARVHALLRRKEQPQVEAAPEFEIMRHGDLELNITSYTASLKGHKLTLPRKEFDSLAYLLRHRGKVISREALLNAVWGENIHVVDRTVDVHIRKIREKLGKHADYIETISGVGYRFRGE
jgi:two-component system alkaline phosphatase synthesis response regulator PhoP